MNHWEGVTELVDKILEEEAATVTFTGPNPDFNGQPDHVVVICNEATGWLEKRFAGETRKACLEAAIAWGFAK